MLTCLKGHLVAQWEQLHILEEQIRSLKVEIELELAEMAKEEATFTTLGKDWALATKYSRIYDPNRPLWRL